MFNLMQGRKKEEKRVRDGPLPRAGSKVISKKSDRPANSYQYIKSKFSRSIVCWDFVDVCRCLFLTGSAGVERLE